MGEPKHRGGNRQVHGEPTGWRWWRQPFRRAQRRSRDIPREPPRHGGRSGRGRRSRSHSSASGNRDALSCPTAERPVRSRTHAGAGYLPGHPPWAPRLLPANELRLSVRLELPGDSRPGPLQRACACGGPHRVRIRHVPRARPPPRSPGWPPTASPDGAVRPIPRSVLWHPSRSNH
jgi:hypothetical protein